MRYSRQRELILTYVQNCDDHPTADMVYKRVRKIIPNISLGTVYRNLNQLCELNLIRKIVFPNKIDRFDKVHHDHGHIYCSNCGRVEDIGKELLVSAYDEIEDRTDFRILSHDVVFAGICDKCLGRKERL
ncbi:MAG: transcriptional repressor [Bacilli bacterium]